MERETKNNVMETFKESFNKICEIHNELIKEFDKICDDKKQFEICSVKWLKLNQQADKIMDALDKIHSIQNLILDEWDELITLL